jgi:hypothetical protein
LLSQLGDSSSNYFWAIVLPDDIIGQQETETRYCWDSLSENAMVSAADYLILQAY